LEVCRDAIPAEIEAARGELSRALATGADPKRHRATAAELDAEAAEIPGTIDALRAELRQAKIDAVADERAKERGGLVKRLDALEKPYRAALDAIHEYTEKVRYAGDLGHTHVNTGAAELEAGIRDRNARYSVSAPVVLPHLETGRKAILQHFDAETAKRSEAAGKAERERSDVGEGLFFDESRGKYRPISERPPREPSEPIKMDLKPRDENPDRAAKKAPGFYESRK
jgi:hypothetical protein